MYIQATHITVSLSPRVCMFFNSAVADALQCIKHCWQLYALLQLQTESINATLFNMCMFAVFMVHCCQQSFGAGFAGVAVNSCATVTVLVFFTWPVCFLQPAAAAVNAMLLVPKLQFFKRTPSRSEGSLMRHAGADTRVACVGPVHTRTHTRGDPSARAVRCAPSLHAGLSQIREPFARIF